MFGYGYTKIRGRAAITIDVVGGYSLNSFRLDSSTLADYQRRGASDIHGEATNTFVVKPELAVWHDSEPENRAQSERRGTWSHGRRSLS